MAKLTSSIDIHTAEFQANAQAMAELVRDLTDKRAAIAEGGPAKARERHQSRGKLLARDRVNQLLDPGTPSSSSRRSRPSACMRTRSMPPG